MAYQVTRINDQIEGDNLFTTFVLTDDSNIMPEIIIEKYFKITDNIDLRIENQKTIDSLFYENQWLEKISN